MPARTVARRDRLRKRGIELYLIADVVFWSPPESYDWALLREHFQAITAYNMYDHPQFLDQTLIAVPGVRSKGQGKRTCLYP